jgi:hypothetical protein
MFRAPFLINDPGSGGTITVDRWGAVCPVDTTGGGARTLAVPTKAGLSCMVVIDVLSGACTLTVTSGYNQADTTSITMGTAGDWVLFKSVKIGSNYRWRVVAQEGTNATVTDVTATTITATTANATSSTITTANVTNANLGRVQVTSTAVNAAGGNIATAGALSYGMNIVAGTDNSTGVILPVAVANGCVEILQTVNGKQLAVYPQVNSSIAGLTANVAFNTGVANTAAQAGTTQNAYFKFVATNATQWYASK